MKAAEPMSPAGTPDFSGYWRQIKNENMDQYLKVTPHTVNHDQVPDVDRQSQRISFHQTTMLGGMN